MERGVILATGPFVALADLPSQIGSADHSVPPVAKPCPLSETVTLEQMEADHIRRVLAVAASIGEAATTLGINPSTLYRKRKKYRI